LVEKILDGYIIQSEIVICVVDVMILLGFVKAIELVGVDFLKVYLWLS